MEELDLNTDNYSLNDIKQFLEIETGKYKDDEVTLNIIDDKAKQKIEKLKLSGIDEATKTKVVMFVNKIKDILRDKILQKNPVFNELVVDKKNDYHRKNLMPSVKMNYPPPITLDKTGDVNNVIMGALRTDETDPRSMNAALFNYSKINRFNRPTVTTQLSIDTKFRKNYFATDPADYSVKLSTPFKNVVSMRLSSIEITNAIYSVSELNGTNGFTITAPIGSSAGSGTFIVKVPTGNYVSNKLTATLEDRIHDITLNSSIPFLNVRVSIDTVTSRTIIERVGTTPNEELDDFELDFTNLTRTDAPPMMTLGWLLGFRNQKYKGSHKYVSECLIDLAGLKYFYFCVDDYQKSANQNVIGVYENSFLSKNILARLPMREGKGIIAFDDGSDMVMKTRKYFGPVNIDNLRITLLDEFGQVLQLNRTDYSFSLELEILYEY